MGLGDLAQSGSGFVYVFVGLVHMTNDSPDEASFFYSFRDIEHGLANQQNSLGALTHLVLHGEVSLRMVSSPIDKG